MRTASFAPCAVALFFFALLLSACEESVDAILDSDRQFTLFATLDMNRDTQFVRVIPIRETLLAPNPEAPIAATVTSTDLVTNRTITWRDSTVRFESGGIGHVFYAPLRVQPSHTYRISVQPIDGTLVTSAETTIPPLPRPRVMPERVESVTTPTGAQIRGIQQIVWENVTRAPFAVEHWYRFLSVGTFAFTDIPMPFPPRAVPSENQPDAWDVTINLQGDRLVVDTLVDLSNKALAGIGMTITVLDEAFVPPGGVFDLEVLAQPGTLSNVENGFGFVGSVGRYSVEWILTEQAARILRYTPISAFKNALPPDVLDRVPPPTARAYPGRHPGF